MPELPDLQAFSLNLSKILKNKKVAAVKLPYTKKVKGNEKQFQQTLAGQKVKSVYREGKELYFEFDKGDVLALHLMLRGNLYVFEEAHDKKYPIVEIYFQDKTGLVLTDFQGAATPRLNPPEHDGTDALSDEVDFKFLKDKFSISKAAVKNILLDQHFIRGIGNAYADEILWHARINPFSIGNRVPDTHLRKLSKAIKSVLTKAEKKILKSNPGIITGEVRDFLDIHHPKKELSPTGGKIKMEVVGGRKTYFTDEQVLFK